MNKKMNKRGISIMIGYVLLITSVVIIGVFVYQWMVTYVPKDPLQCPDGVSISIKDANFNCATFQLNLTLQNNGRFNIAGYFIHATNNTNQTLAIIDLSQNITQGGEIYGNAVKFFGPENSMKPNDKIKNIFNLTSQIYSIEIIPVRFQIEKDKKRFISCGDVKIREEIICS